MFNRSKKLFDKGKNLAAKGQKARAFFADPKNIKLFQQYLKVSSVQMGSPDLLLCFCERLVSDRHVCSPYLPTYTLCVYLRFSSRIWWVAMPCTSHFYTHAHAACIVCSFVRGPLHAAE